MNTIYVAAANAQAGPIGLAIVVVLGIVVAFLGKSMTRHLSKLPESFDKKSESPERETAVPEPDQPPTAALPGAVDRPSDGTAPH